MSSGSEEGGGGFGIVTLASAFPIIMVLGIGFVLSASMPQPSNAVAFFRGANKEVMMPVFGSMKAAEQYVPASTDQQIPDAYYGSTAAAAARRAAVEADPDRRSRLLPTAPSSTQQSTIELGQLFTRNDMGALQAILPLTGLLLIVFLLAVRDRLPDADEVFLGIALSILGMASSMEVSSWDSPARVSRLGATCRCCTSPWMIAHHARFSGILMKR